MWLKFSFFFLMLDLLDRNVTCRKGTEDSRDLNMYLLPKFFSCSSFTSWELIVDLPFCIMQFCWLKQESCIGALHRGVRSSAFGQRRALP